MLEIIDISEIFELLEISKIMKTSESDRVDPSGAFASKNTRINLGHKLLSQCDHHYLRLCD